MLLVNLSREPEGCVPTCDARSRANVWASPRVLTPCSPRVCSRPPPPHPSARLLMQDDTPMEGLHVLRLLEWCVIVRDMRVSSMAAPSFYALGI